MTTESTPDQAFDSSLDKLKLLASMRHELRTPINHILGYSEMLQEEAEDHGRKGLISDLQRIQDAGQQLLTLVNDNLDATKIETGKISISRLRHELRTPINTIVGYSEMLQEVVEDEDGEDFVLDLQKISSAAKQLLVLVNDSHAFSEILADDIVPGRRVSSGSEIGQDVEDATRLSQGTGVPSIPTVHGTLLVVDDNEMNREILSRRLQRDGHTVAVAESGPQSLEMIEANSFDLVLLDIMMPDMDGYQVLERLKSDDVLRHIPVIMLSALDEIDSVVRCIELGAEDYLSKPFNPVLLRARIGACLEKKRLRDQERLYLQQIEDQLQEYAKRLINIPEGAVKIDFAEYDLEGFHDEMIDSSEQPWVGSALLAEFVEGLPAGQLLRHQRAAEQAFTRLGINFNVYGDESGVDRIWPFDILPRIVEASDWSYIERGLKQRIHVLNTFINDIYHDQKIVKDGVVPGHMIQSARNLLPACMGLNPPKGIWCHITGTDLVRDGNGTIFVLEDNLRCPSGVSYVLENRQVLKATFPEVFEASQVRPVDDYPSRLLETLRYIAPEGTSAPVVVLLTPGIYNSAYFEHAFLSQQMGIELVEGRDLTVVDGYVMMRTTQGMQRVDVIYRRIDDEFLDPLVFRSDSQLGVPGLMEVFRQGRVALANAPGTGIADDKAIYAYVPQMVKYYLGEEIILPNVETYICWDDIQRSYVLDNLDRLVVKATNESGGYGMLIGPHATTNEREDFAQLIKANPRNYIAQPTLDLSRAPVIVEDHFEGRHIDLRPYILHGADTYVLPGGLTRVALRKGSLVVNSSQGGGSKDSWVLVEEQQ